MRNPIITRRACIAAMGTAAAALTLGGCSAGSGTTSTDSTTFSNVEDKPANSLRPTADQQTKIQNLLDKMTLEQKIGQLFIVTPEELTGVDDATAAGQTTHDALATYPVGGLCYFAKNITGADQLRTMISNTKTYCSQVGAGIAPFISVDEEGGSRVARVANSGYFDVKQFPDMAEIGAAGDTAQAANVGTTIGNYLRDIGFNVDFAPDADVLTNPNNQVIGQRAFSSDANVAAEMVAAEVKAMTATGTLPCIKHFPGHGDTEGDSHTGAVYATRTREQMESCELLPFKAGIEAGCPLVMVGHIETPNFAADGLPASLSPTMIGDVLRGQLGFEGVIVSDSFSMGAITESYAGDDAAVRFIKAGGDVILMPSDLPVAYNGLLSAVKAGSISTDRIDESVARVLTAKLTAGLIE